MWPFPTRKARRPVARPRPSFRPRLEYLEERTLLTGPAVSPGVSFTTVESQTEAALSSNAFFDVPGLTATAPAAGLYQLGASVTFANTASAAGTEVGLELVAGGQVVDSRILSFAPNSNSFQASLDVAANLSLSVGELVEVKARTLNSGGSAQYGSGPHDLRLVRPATPPVVTSPGNQASQVGDSITVAIAASDSDGMRLVYSASGLPADLTINFFTGVISGTISNQAASSVPYTVTVPASDGINSGSTSFTWTVRSASNTTNPPPVQFSAFLITKKVHKKAKLFIHVSSSAGLEEDILCPFQNPAFKSITATVDNAGNVFVSGKKGKKTVMTTFAV